MCRCAIMRRTDIGTIPLTHCNVCLAPQVNKNRCGCYIRVALRVISRSNVPKLMSSAGKRRQRASWHGTDQPRLSQFRDRVFTPTLAQTCIYIHKSSKKNKTLFFRRTVEPFLGNSSNCLIGIHYLLCWHCPHQVSSPPFAWPSVE